MNAMRIRVVAALVSAAIPIVSAASAEAPLGAASCSGCHAANANVETAVPRFAGRNAAELVAQNLQCPDICGQVKESFKLVLR
jgi:cytochrome c553